jgi:hypothetical protein
MKPNVGLTEVLRQVVDRWSEFTNYEAYSRCQHNNTTSSTAMSLLIPKLAFNDQQTRFCVENHLGFWFNFSDRCSSWKGMTHGVLELYMTM